MTRFRHDQSAKELLKSMLEPLGSVSSQHEVPAEALYIDVVFEGPNPTLEPADFARLGLLGRLVQQPCLFEPYRSTLQDAHLVNGMAKLCWSRLEHQRRQSKIKGKERDSPTPQLWILCPDATEARLGAHALQAAGSLEPALADGRRAVGRWPTGVYTVGTGWGFGVIVLSELPPVRETLLLRLLGKGATQRLAIEQLRELPEDDPLRKPVLHLLLKWRIIVQERPPETEEDQEVSMLIDHTYDEWITKTRNEGRQEGRQEGRLEGLLSAMRRTWLRRFGEIPAPVVAYLEGLDSSEALESALDQVLSAKDGREAMFSLGVLV